MRLCCGLTLRVFISRIATWCKSKPAIMTKRSDEVAAREARAAALKHLSATGTGPSQYELGNVSHGINQGLERGDNTLQELVARRARTHPQQVGSSLSQKRPLEIPRSATAKSSSKLVKSTAIKAIGCKKVVDRGLPHGWQQTIDTASGEVYYWNELTQETSWTKPSSTENEGEKEEMKELPQGWQMVLDPTTNSVYYWNMHTHETQWERPVSFEQAIEAKSKLDQVLRGLKHDRENDDGSDSSKPKKKSKVDDDATLKAFLDDVDR
ncbi:hypothetical protein THRCLA_07806 [Thraustotheca clavata]|uniref:WW domain-containing protein n=1 Tax=Thraustotheca clavata TaxID=74557 RepID=A0A1V9ZC59_9STRA|nr:hypothetical protein THRCLA_07806 [Thraustotheca clavata]